MFVAPGGPMLLAGDSITGTVALGVAANQP